MVVVVILGILSVVAVPAYRDYIIDSKVAEAYSNLDAVIKSETTFFSDNDEFHFLAQNPETITSGMTIGTNASWDQFGYIIPNGSNVFFSYATRAGKIDSTGAELGASSIAGNVFNLTTDDGILSAVTSDGDCNDDSATAVTYGVSVQNGLDWVVVKATGDLDGDSTDSLCTSVLKVIQTDPSNSLGPSSGGFIIVNKGS